jgi:hypothetical protein
VYRLCIAYDWPETDKSQCVSRKSGKIFAGTNYTALRILSFNAHFPARTSHQTGFDPSAVSLANLAVAGVRREEQDEGDGAARR